jgi:hypothetical protein
LSLTTFQDAFDGTLPTHANLPQEIKDLLDTTSQTTNYATLIAGVFGKAIVRETSGLFTAAAYANAAAVKTALEGAYPAKIQPYNYANWLIAKESYESNIKSKFFTAPATLDVAGTTITSAQLAFFAGANGDEERENYALFVDWMTEQVLEILPFPDYIPPSGVEFEAEEDGSYVIERIRLNTLDTQTYKFGIKLTNFMSPTNPAATNSNAWTNIDGLKKEFLTLTKAATSPASLDNLIFNQINSKVGIELGELANNGTEIDDLDATTTSKFMYYASGQVAAGAQAFQSLDGGGQDQIVNYSWLSGAAVVTNYQNGNVGFGSRTDYVSIRWKGFILYR